MKNKNTKTKMPTSIKKGTASRLIKYMRSYYKKELLVVLICIVLSSVAMLTGTVFMQKLIDNAIIPGIKTGWNSVLSKIASIILTMGIVYLIGVLASFIYTRIMAIVTQGTLAHFRKDMFGKMETLPIKYFDTNAHGDIMSTYTNDTDALRQFIGQSMSVIIQSVISIAITIVVMLSYSLWLTLLTLAICFFMVVIAGKLASGTTKYMIKQQASLAKEEGYIEEMIKGQKVVKVFCHQEESKKDFKKLNEQLYSDSETANVYGNLIPPVLGNAGNIMYVLLAIFGGLLVFYNVTNIGLSGIGTISIGVIITFLTLSRQVSQTINQMSMQAPMIAMGIAGAERIFDLLDKKPEYDNGYVELVKARKSKDGVIEETEEYTGLWAWKHTHKAKGTTTYTELKGDIQMFNVDFGYVKNKTVLKDISLYAKPGQKIAFVGATGAGKTTITNLINRFYDIEDGKIRYDGININKIKKPDLRRSLAIVLQDVNLFAGTVMDNIRYGKLDATDEECIEAAKLANADDFISRLPEGYNTELANNGANLSQGQRQLISIARAAVANAPAMILDEATSSIDTHTEELVQDGMDKLMKGRTVFVIAHRLSTVRNSDAIIVLDQGKIIERGNHDQLLEQKGTYYQLYTGAFELE